MTNLTQVLIQKAGGKLFLNGEEIGPGTVDVRLDGLTYRASEKVEVKQPDQEPVAPDDESICDDWISASDSDGIAYDGPSFECGYKIGRIAERDAQPEQEPVATMKMLHTYGHTTPPAAQPAYGDIRALKHRIHELEGEVIGYKRMIEEAALKKLADLGQQIEQEPVAWIAEVELSVFARTPKEKTTVEIWKKPVLDSDVAIYTTPPAAQRKPLTDERILHLVNTHVGGPSPGYPLDNSDWINFARAIEAAHGIKDGA